MNLPKEKHYYQIKSTCLPTFTTTVYHLASANLSERIKKHPKDNHYLIKLIYIDGLLKKKQLLEDWEF